MTSRSSRRIINWDPPRVGNQAYDPWSSGYDLPGRHYSAVPQHGVIGTFKIPGISRSLALLSQAAGLASTAMISLSFLVFDQSALVAYTAVTAPLLLVISAFDAGMNQDFLLSGKKKFWVYGKVFLTILSIALLLVISINGLEQDHVLAASLYGAALVFFSGCLAMTWRKHLYRLEAAARLAVGVITVLATLLAVWVRADAVLTILLAQATGMVILGLFVLFLAWSANVRVGGVLSESAEQPTRYLQGILSAFTRGLILNVISNGVFLMAQAAGASEPQLVDVRVVTLVAVAVNAATPVAPQHFIALTRKQQNQLTNALLSAGLVFLFVAICMHFVPTFDYKAMFSAAAVGVCAGALITRLHLRVNAGTFSIARMAQTTFASLCCAAGVFISQDALGGSNSILLGTLLLVAVFGMCDRFTFIISNRAKAEKPA